MYAWKISFNLSLPSCCYREGEIFSIFSIRALFLYIKLSFNIRLLPHMHDAASLTAAVTRKKYEAQVGFKKIAGNNFFKCFWSRLFPSTIADNAQANELDWKFTAPITYQFRKSICGFIFSFRLFFVIIESINYLTCLERIRNDCLGRNCTSVVPCFRFACKFVF